MPLCEVKLVSGKNFHQGTSGEFWTCTNASKGQRPLHQCRSPMSAGAAVTLAAGETAGAVVTLPNTSHHMLLYKRAAVGVWSVSNVASGIFSFGGRKMPHVYYIVEHWC